jgi:hypothetical protein
MGRLQTKKVHNALLAFGRRVSPGDAFEELKARGWQKEVWHPTFVESGDRDRFECTARDEPFGRREVPWDDKQVLRCPVSSVEPPGPPGESEPRLMVASADDLPSLYFVEWHYIDFVMSCLGNVSETARILGVRRSTLQRKRKKTPPTR